MVRIVIAIFCFGMMRVSIASAQSLDADHFESRIRPTLIERCFKCHGGDQFAQDLRVDSREALLRGGESGPALIPGDVERSLLIRALRPHDDELQMPPDEPLSAALVKDFERWVATGAVWPDDHVDRENQFSAARHWAFRPLQSVQVPKGLATWSRHPIDRFVSAAWSSRGIRPVAAATRREWLRRLSFGLRGLPPRSSDVERFLADDRPGAELRQIDWMLTSPQYGERWGRHWMDVVRYADTAGDNADYPIPEAFRYRDYIIAAFNNDRPYDQFVREQIAGDLLAETAAASDDEYAQRRVATGFLALSRRYGTMPYELWHLTLEDTVDTVGRAFLGMTLRCARCHDHKFDPVSTTDYYRMYGIFASTQYPWAGGEEFHSKQVDRQHFVVLLPPDRAAAARSAFDDLKERLQQSIEAAADDEQRSALQAELKRLLRSSLPPGVPGAYAVGEGSVADVALHLRGDPHQPGDIVPRGVPTFLDAGGGFSSESFGVPLAQSGRLQLAEWLTDAGNPLIARVLVNRVWQHHFGRGLVETPSNFGMGGASPTHPELLDYLATEFLRSGFSIKHLHRLILSSKTYQLSSVDDQDNSAIDQINQWYWRFERQRLDAESLRDAILAVSGQLNLERPGAHSFPPIETWKWTQHDAFKQVFETRHRSVYLMNQRLQRHPFLALFDGPDTNTSTPIRAVSTVPAQALFLRNNPWLDQQARALAKSICTLEAGELQRIVAAHRRVFARSPDPFESERWQAYLTRARRRVQSAELDGIEADVLLWTSVVRVLFASNEFVYVD